MTANRVKGTAIAASAMGRNAIPAHTAMNGQSFAQSGLFWASGQHGMPSGMSVDAASALTTTISIDAAMAVGVADGARASPSQARAAKRCRMVSWRFTATRIPQQNEIGKIVSDHYRKKVIALALSQIKAARLRCIYFSWRAYGAHGFGQVRLQERVLNKAVQAGMWLHALRVYLVSTAAINLAWETLQLPLYTIWRSATLRSQAFAVVHCTIGDVLIALSALAVALLVAGDPAWPDRRFRSVALPAIAFGLAYTIFSEWLNVEVRGSWAYSQLMPVVMLFGLRIGLSPLLQWLVVPALAFMIMKRVSRPIRP